MIATAAPSGGRDTSAVDFLIVTILDTEFDAVRRHIAGLSSERYRDDAIVYYRGHLGIAGGDSRERYSIAVVQLNGMGNPNAAVAVTLALQRFEPQAVIVVGIAGGVPGEIEIGDVAVSRDLIYYEYGKQYEERFEHRASAVRADPVLASHAKAFAENDWHSRISVEPPGASRDAHVPAVKIGTIGSGEKVVDSTRFITNLKARHKHLIAVAMEGAGAATPAQYLGKRAGDILEIRGISDLADGTKADDWQAYAADAAAAFMVALLTTGPITPIDARERKAKEALRFTAIRASSFALVNPDGVVAPLRALGATEIDDADIDLTSFAGGNGRVREIAGAVAALCHEDGAYLRALGAGGRTQLALYGQLHIPFAALAGTLATDRIAVRLFDFHRNADPPGWFWPAQKQTSYPALTASTDIDESAPPEDAIVRVSISYPIDAIQTSPIIARARYSYDLGVPAPAIDIVDSEVQARAYARVVRATLDALTIATPRPKRIHLFYAGPVSVAFAIGQTISPTIHPTVVIWNYRAGAYDWGVNIARALDGESAVVHPIDFNTEGL